MDWPMKPRAEPPLDDIPSPLCESLAILILRDTEATPCEPRPARLQIDLAGGTSNHAEVPDMSVYHTWANHSFVNPDVIYALVCSDACLCGCGLRSFPLGIWFQGTKPTAKQRRQVLHKLRSGSPKRFVWSFHLNERFRMIRAASSRSSLGAQSWRPLSSKYSLQHCHITLHLKRQLQHTYLIVVSPALRL